MWWVGMTVVVTVAKVAASTSVTVMVAPTVQ